MENCCILDELIKNELCKFSDDTSRQKNKKVITADKSITAIMDKINKSDGLLGDELENATDLLMLSYSEMYFREGFLTAIKLVNEINKVS